MSFLWKFLSGFGFDMGQNNMRAEQQDENNVLGQRVSSSDSDNQEKAPEKDDDPQKHSPPYEGQRGNSSDSDNQEKAPEKDDDPQKHSPPYEASLKRATLNPLRKYYGCLNRPHDVIRHAGRYVVTDTYNGRIVALSANNTYSVLYEAKSQYLPFRPFSIVALSDTENNFLITDLHHNKRKGCVFKLKSNKLTQFSSTFDDFRTPTGITLNRKRDRVYIVDSFYNCILEFYVNGTYLGPRCLNSLTHPWFIACNSQDEVYVTDEEGIKVFDRNWRYLTTVTINIYGKTWRYRGIAIDTFDNIFITARSRDSVLFLSKETVAAINADHELVKEYTGGIFYHNFLRGVCIDYERNRVVVVNGEKHTIETYSLH